jgi:hypothetical protein
LAIKLISQAGSFSGVLGLGLTEHVGERDAPQREPSGDRQHQGKRVATEPEAKLAKDRCFATGQGRFAFEPPPKVVGQCIRRPVTRCQIAVQALEADRIELVIDVTVDRPGLD